jgi:thiol:disulfide interchange protein DsbD
MTHLQLFGIGLSFGIAGPCFFTCAPVLLTYVVGKREKYPATVFDISVFLAGRLAAYLILGAVAGASAAALRQFNESGFIMYVRPLGGVMSILLGLSVLLRKGSCRCAGDGPRNPVYGLCSVLVLGFIIGISPCAPLLALLFEIALMSRSILDGVSYAFSFGLGTLLSGFIVVGALAGILKGATDRLVRSEGMVRFFRIACAALLIALGAGIVFSNQL